MNRRKFLEMIGMATGGGVVAYSFPSVIVPKNINITPTIDWHNGIITSTGHILKERECSPPINFSALDKAYRILCKGNLEPNSIYVPIERFAEIRKLTYGYLKFHGADIKVDPHIKDGSLYIENPEFRRLTIEGFSRFEIT